MASRRSEPLLEFIRHLTDGDPRVSDQDLLDRFVRLHDQGAFKILMRRHCPMVLRACQGVLVRPEDAEDAVQATFLVLAREARTITSGQAIGAWLHKSAMRVALQ